MQLRTPLGCANLNRAEGKGSQQRSTGTAGRRCVWGHRRAAPFISARWDEKPRAECLTWGWGAVWTRLSPTAARGGLTEVGTRWDLWVAAPRSAAPRPVAPSPAPSAAPRGRKARTGRAGRARNDGVGREGPARPRGLAPRPPRAAAPGWAMGEVCVCVWGGWCGSPRPSAALRAVGGLLRRTRAVTSALTPHRPLSRPRAQP